MSFINPWLLLGILAVAGPIILHLRSRRAAAVHRFAAIDFLLSSSRELTLHLRLREALLLALRCLIVAGLAFALAGPLLKMAPVGLNRSAPASTVIILDDSMSMRTRVGGRTLFDAAKDRCEEIIRGMGARDELALLPISRADAPPPLEKDGGMLLSRLERLEPSFLKGNAASALRNAADALASASLASRRVVVISDFRSGTWDEESRGAVQDLAAKGISLTPVDVSDGKAFDNCSIAGLSSSGDSGRLRIGASVRNHSASAKKTGTCRLMLEGGSEVAVSYSVDPGGESPVEFNIANPPSGGLISGSCSIEDDALAEDNVLYFTVFPPGPSRALLVDGDPRARILDSETYYLARALEPGREHKSAFSVEICSAPELADRNTSGYAAIFLCNCSVLDDSSAQKIAAFLQSGGIVFITLGDCFINDELPESLRSIMPGEFASDTPHGGTQGQPARAAKFGPGWRASSDSAGALYGLTSGRIEKYFLTKPAPDSEILITLDNEAPLLLGRRISAGYCLMLTTSIDRDWSDLCIQPGFLPLLHILLRNLLGRDAGDMPPVVETGNSIFLPPTASGANIFISRPDRRVTAPMRSGVGEEYGPIELPGIYRAVSGKADGPVSWAFAANATRDESTLSVFGGVAEGLLAGNVGKKGEMIEARAEYRPLWRILLPLLLALTLIEAYIARK
ncbi:MAG TPA: BatA domain-containing protein [Candidatus Brocadiia bacterium]|nr:BatA domain-containing protein [Candidatus Brocadiia bacterium]